MKGKYKTECTDCEYYTIPLTDDPSERFCESCYGHSMYKQKVTCKTCIHRNRDGKSYPCNECEDHSHWKSNQR